MPLTTPPLNVFPSKSLETERQQGHGRRHAVAFTLTSDAAAALKAAIANVKLSAGSYGVGSGPLQVSLAGDKPGLTIAGQFYPVDLHPPLNNASYHSELYVRTRHLRPKTPSEHRPPVYYAAPIVAKASVRRRAEDDVGQRIRERTAVMQQQKDRHIQMLDAPPVTTTIKSKSSAAGKSKKKTPGGSTASTLARSVLQKGGGAIQAKNEGSSSRPSTPSPSFVGSSQKLPPPASSPTPPTPSSSPPDITSLRSRVIHQLALKSSTYQDLRPLVKNNENESLSEILRHVANPDPSAGGRSTQTHWSPPYTSPSKHTGLWRLKPDILATDVHPYTYPHYQDSERERIAEDVSIAQTDLPETAPARTRLRAEATAWAKGKRVVNGTEMKRPSTSTQGSASSSKPAMSAMTPGTTVRKVKMNKMSAPPSSGGAMLSGSMKPGMVKSASSNGSTPTTKAQNDKGSGRDSDVETKSKVKKRVSPPSNLSGRATPMSASSSGSTTSSAALAHGLPPKPATSFAPAAVRSSSSSRTPPHAAPLPTRPPSTQPSKTSTPNISPRVNTSTSNGKRLRDDTSDLDDTALFPNRTKAGRESLHTTAGGGSKKQRLSELPATNHNRTPSAASTASAVGRKDVAHVNGTKVAPSTSRASSSRDDIKSSNSLKPPIQLTNGRVSPAGSSAKDERGPSPLPSFRRKDHPLAASPAPSQTNKRPRDPSSTKHRSDVHEDRQGKAKSMRKTPQYTSSSEEEEEKEEDVRPPPAKKTKLLQPPPSPSTRPIKQPARRIKALPNPLPKSRKELRLLHSEKVVEKSAITHEIAQEISRTRQCDANLLDQSALWTEEELLARKADGERLDKEIEMLVRAVEESLEAEQGGGTS